MAQKHKAWPLIFLLFCVFVNVETASGDGWEIKRTDRKQLVIQRLKSMLRRQPFSSYAFRRLTGYHSKGSARKRLVSIYQKKARNNPKNVSNRIVLARLLVWTGQYSKALPHYKWLSQKKPNWTRLALAQARCLLALKQTSKALQIFRITLPKLKGTERQKTLKNMLVIVLKSKEQLTYIWVYDKLKKLSWNRFDTLSFARKLTRHQKLDAAMFFYKKALAKSKGGPKFQLLLEICRAQLAADRFQEAQGTLQTARKIRTTHQWLKWELIQLEIEIARKQNRLAHFAESLAQKWASSREYKKIILLARLYKELKWKTHAKTYFTKALKIRPSSPEAHNYLIGYYTSLGDQLNANKHIRQLIRYRTAQPKHYLGLSRSLLRDSGHPYLLRWQESWKKQFGSTASSARPARIKRTLGSRIRRLRSRGYGRYKYRYGYRYRRKPYYGSLNYHKRSKASWRQYRQKRWAQWKRYVTAAQKKSFQEATQILKSGIQRFTRDWNALKDLELLSEQHGLKAIAKMAEQKMVLSTGAYPERLSYMKELLENKGKPKAFKSLIYRALRKSMIIPKNAADLASFAFAWSLQNKTAPKQSGNQHYLASKKAICPSIRRFLRPVLKRITRSFQKKHPFLCARLFAQASVCGETKRTEPLLQGLEKKYTLAQEDRNKLAQVYLKSHYMKGMERILKTMLDRPGQDPWLHFAKNHFSKSLTPHTMRFLVQRLQNHLAQKPEQFCKILKQFCKNQKLCQNIEPAIQHLLSIKKLSPIAILDVIHTTSKYDLFLDKRPNWLKTLRQRHPNNTKLFYWLVKHPTIYKRKVGFRSRRYRNRGRWISPALEQEHQNVLLAWMRSRQLLPDRYKNWLLQMKPHLQESSKTS